MNGNMFQICNYKDMIWSIECAMGIKHPNVKSQYPICYSHGVVVNFEEFNNGKKNNLIQFFL